MILCDSFMHSQSHRVSTGFVLLVAQTTLSSREYPALAFCVNMVFTVADSINRCGFFPQYNWIKSVFLDYFCANIEEFLSRVLFF